MTDATPPAPAPSQSLGGRLNALIVLALLVLVSLWVRILGLMPSVAPHWQYQIVAPPDEALQSQLNRLGADGWEIVAARRATSTYGAASYEMILKRPGVGASAQVAVAERGDPGTASMKSDLRNLVTAQEAYFSDNVTYAKTIGALNYVVAVGDSVVITAASGTGWSATAKSTATSKTCGIFIGSATPPFAGQDEGAPLCQ